MRDFFTHWRKAVQELKRQIAILLLALRHPQVPWPAKLVIAFTLAYASSPIDLIPDFIPVLGLLDDLLILPAGLIFALKMIPPDVRSRLADEAMAAPQTLKPSLGGLALILTLWLAAAYGTSLLLINR